MEPLTRDELDWLQSLKELELQEWLSPMVLADKTAILEQMASHTGPTERMEQSLHEFVLGAWHVVEPAEEFIDNWHIQAVCKHLEAVTHGDIKNLLINIPPGCCKSLLCCVFWPAWVWTTMPDKRWLFAAYGQDLSIRDSEKCRHVIESPWYQERWGGMVKLSQDQNQKTKFSNEASGWRMATSTTGRGTGEHPDFVVFDDPHNVKQAESDVEREAAIKFWDRTISSRGVIRGSRRVVVMQRLHEADLSGHIIEKNDSSWDHICLPMEYEPPTAKGPRMRPTRLGWSDERTIKDELLWPAAMPLDVVRGLQKNMGSNTAAGQLQQRPVPAGGGMFKREWFDRAHLPCLPTRHRPWNFVRYWDKAGTEGGGDWTVGILMVEMVGAFYILDMVRGQWSYMNRESEIVATAHRDRHRYGAGVNIVLEQDVGASGKESAAETVRRLAGFIARAELVRGSKAVRAQNFAAQSEAGNVWLVNGPDNKWDTEALIDELIVFPFGRHDDAVDACSGSFNKLCEKMVRNFDGEAGTGAKTIQQQARAGIVPVAGPNAAASVRFQR